MCKRLHLLFVYGQGADPSGATVKSAAAGAPPPPPPPAIQPPSDVPATQDDNANRAALFAAINKGSGVTAGEQY